MARSLFLVSCVSSKLDRPAPARDLYVSDLFKKVRAYVEKAGQQWFVLSADHGLVHPDTVLAPYEKTLNRMPIAERRAWATRVLTALEPQLPDTDRVVFMAGERYREFLMEPLRLRVQVEVPMAGLTIGRQLQWLSQHTSRS